LRKKCRILGFSSQKNGKVDSAQIANRLCRKNQLFFRNVVSEHPHGRTEKDIPRVVSFDRINPDVNKSQ
jgi:hypothetical protein